jgi:hypothetical protein
MKPVPSGRLNSARRQGASQSGEGRLKAIFWTLVLFSIIYVGYKLVPPYVALYQLRDKMEEEARFAVVNRHTDDQIRDIVFRQVQDLDIPVKREDIKVGNTNSAVKISLEYAVPLDLLFYHTELHFNASSDVKSLF